MLRVILPVLALLAATPPDKIPCVASYLELLPWTTRRAAVAANQAVVPPPGRDGIRQVTELLRRALRHGVAVRITYRSPFGAATVEGRIENGRIGTRALSAIPPHGVTAIEFLQELPPEVPRVEARFRLEPDRPDGVVPIPPAPDAARAEKVREELDRLVGNFEQLPPPWRESPPDEVLLPLVADWLAASGIRARLVTQPATRAPGVPAGTKVSWIEIEPDAGSPHLIGRLAAAFDRNPLYRLRDGRRPTIRFQSIRARGAWNGKAGTLRLHPFLVHGESDLRETLMHEFTHALYDSRLLNDEKGEPSALNATLIKAPGLTGEYGTFVSAQELRAVPVGALAGERVPGQPRVTTPTSGPARERHRAIATSFQGVAGDLLAALDRAPDSVVVQTRESDGLVFAQILGIPPGGALSDTYILSVPLWRGTVEGASKEKIRVRLREQLTQLQRETRPQESP